jgi:Protein of unknown function (DUF992)
MKKLLMAAAVSVFAFAPLVSPAEAVGGVKIGVLECAVDGGVGFIIGSTKDADCVFHPSGSGETEHYNGSVGKFGVDIGVTGRTQMGWAVFAPGRIESGALRGHYTGASAEATVGLGLGANVLVGGFKDGINLQPISIQAQTGLNVAAGIGSLTLN